MFVALRNVIDPTVMHLLKKLNSVEKIMETVQHVNALPKHRTLCQKVLQLKKVKKIAEENSMTFRLVVDTVRCDTRRRLQSKRF